MKLPSPTHEYLVEQLTNSLPSTKKWKLVDYGCGAGALLSFLPAAKVGEYTGYDVNKAALAQANKEWKSRKVSFKLLTVGKVPTLAATNSVDAVILVGVWQYLSTSEQEQLLLKARRCLKKGGILLISCSVNHWPYRAINLYRHFVPHYYVERPLITYLLNKAGFELKIATEKGLFIAPLFSNVISFLVDGLDYVLWRKPGTIGRLGELARLLVAPLIALEFKLPVDYGYTLLIVGKK